MNAGLGAALTIFTVIVGSWFAVRVHKLEDRVDVLEREQQADWEYIRGLQDYIYKNGLTPPTREELL